MQGQTNLVEEPKERNKMKNDKQIKLKTNLRKRIEDPTRERKKYEQSKTLKSTDKPHERII